MCSLNMSNIVEGYSVNTLNKKLVKVGQVGSKGGSSLVNHLVD